MASQGDHQGGSEEGHRRLFQSKILFICLHLPVYLFISLKIYLFTRSFNHIPSCLLICTSTTLIYSQFIH